VSRRFELAQQEIEKYKQIVDYRKFDQSDRRTVSAPQISVIVVSHHAGPTLLNCLHSVLAQEGPSFEVILVDNGGNEHVHDELTKLPLLFVKLPMNLLPSEGRNIGAHFARSELLVFLDDDAVMAGGYLKSGFAAMKDDSRMGLRGQALSKTANKIAPKHYSLGQTPTQAEFNLEGNMLIRKTVLDAVGGFDALMFGQEGKELTQRCKRQFPDKMIQYRPKLCIEHDFAETDLLEAKRDRQSLGKDYLNFLQSKNMNSGISILIRADDDLAAAEDFLLSLLKHNSYKPIEVLLWAKNVQQALNMSSSYITQIFIRVLPTGMTTLGRINQQARYENLLIVDLPFKITGDVLHGWAQQKATNQTNSIWSNKQKTSTLDETPLNTKLADLAMVLGQPLPYADTKVEPLLKSQPKHTTSIEKPHYNNTVSSSKPTEKSKIKTELEGKIFLNEQKIHEIEFEITQIDVDIIQLENQYHLLLEKTPEKQALKDALKDKVLASCSLLIDLKDAQDKQQELRIHSICGAEK
jgi:glycosyltransferase involved in cell wall biosynthesis